MICNNTQMQPEADLYKAETPVCMINIKYCCNIVFYVLLKVQQPYLFTLQIKICHRLPYLH